MCAINHFDNFGVCDLCETFTARGLANRTGANCTSPGLTLSTLPLKSGYWRVNHRVWRPAVGVTIDGIMESEVIRPCFTDGACVGSNETHPSPCAEGHHSAFCDSCEWPAYFKGERGRCERCDDASPSSYASAAIVLALLLVLLVLATRDRCKRGHPPGPFGLKPFDINTKAAPESILQGALDSALQGALGNAGHGSSRWRRFQNRLLSMVIKIRTLIKSMRRFQTRLLSMGIKIRILISFSQVLSGVNVVFNIP